MVKFNKTKINKKNKWIKCKNIKYALYNYIHMNNKKEHIVVVKHI